jgi:hypothetical protein
VGLPAHPSIASVGVGLPASSCIASLLASRTHGCSLSGMKENASAASLKLGPSDFKRAKLGDPRRTERLVKIAQAVAVAPDKSFPQLMSSAELEGFYRFVNSPHVTAGPIVEAHTSCTAERISRLDTVLVIHDTTQNEYSGVGTRSRLCQLGANRQGFLAQVALAVTADGSRRPLGVLGLHTWTRLAEAKLPKAKKKLKAYLRRPNKESARWWKLVKRAEDASTPGKLVHITDREGDSYELLGRLTTAKYRFVIRARHNLPRNVQAWLEGPIVKLQEALTSSTHVFEAKVPITKRVAGDRPTKALKDHPPRDARDAKLQYSTLSVRVSKPKNSPHLKNLPETLDLNFVYVSELNPPSTEEAVEWLLATSEPIETIEDVAQVVEWYRTRWMIEEFFKAVKTGCSLEKRQHESYDALLTTLAIFLPIACQLLELRSVARSAPDSSGSDVLTPLQITVLRTLGTKPLAAQPTVHDCLLAVAAFGGHLRQNGPPGWLTLTRGMVRLNQAVVVWEASRADLAHI